MSSGQTGQFTAAMRARDWTQAQRLLAELPHALPDHMLRSVAELHMLMERWVEGAQTLSLMKHRNSDAEMRRKLCLNLASMRKHRPAVYKALLEAEPSERYTIAASKTGHPTIFLRNEQGLLSMSADNDPLGCVKVAMNSIDPAYRGGKTLGLVGVGDGHILLHLAKNPPDLILGREQAICLFEPDPHLLLACLMLHDYTGPDGPIEQQRISWYVGPMWVMQFRDEFFDDLFKLYPAIMIRTGLQSAMIEQELAKFLKDIADLDKRLASETREYYQRIGRDDFLAMLGENPPLQPRVLVLTTRFSTVLQYSSADTADAFTRLGWEAHVVIEPSASHGLNRIALREAIHRFKPDVIFQIDHLRSEYGELFPPNVPAICWIQDHLPNLMDAKAGAAITLRDFVLAESARMYHQQFGYPLRQCIYLNKATRVPAMSGTTEQDGDEIVFVSNCSRDPRKLADELIQRIEGKPVIALVSDLCDRIIARYSAGEFLATMPDLNEALGECEQAHGIRAGNDEQRDRLLHALWHPFNDSLYRQQALRWAADAAQSMGLRMALYGNGWENNAEFGNLARGYARYGGELEALTRRTKINLHIVPFGCMHQRLLDGLVCGGFFLVRDHPASHFASELSNFMTAHLPDEAATVEDARRALSGEALGRFEQLMTRYRRLSASGDPVARIREACHAGLVTKLPRLTDVSFSNPQELSEKLRGYVEAPELRSQVAIEQRRFVESYFTYEANMKRVIETIRGLIATEPAQPLGTAA